MWPSVPLYLPPSLEGAKICAAFRSLQGLLEGQHFASITPARHVYTCFYTYMFIWYPPQRPRFSYIHTQLGRWRSQSEIDGMGLRVGGLRVSSLGFRVKDVGSIAFQIPNRYIRQTELAASYYITR